MSNPQNLKSMADMTAERQREIASMGGKASQAAAKKRKTLREAYLHIAGLPYVAVGKTAEAFAAEYKKLGGEDIDYDKAIVYAQIIAAANGDKGAAEFIRDTIGEKQPETIDSTVRVVLDGETSDFAK